MSVLTSVVPPLLYQTRRVKQDCDSEFAQVYNKQPINPQYDAPYNAPRADDILHCRSRELQYATHLGMKPYIFKDEPVFSVFLDSNIISSMQRLDWIDDMTESAHLVLFLYTPSQKIWSVVLLDFEFRDTGRVVARYTVSSFLELKESVLFYPWILCGVVMVVLTIWEFCRTVGQMRALRQLDMPGLTVSGTHYFDLFLYSAMIIFVSTRIVLVLLWEGRSSKDLLYPLVENFLMVSDTDSEKQIQLTLDTFFGSLATSLAFVQELKVLQMICCVLVLLVIARVILHFNVHPRIAIVSDTIMQAKGDILHFIFVFVIVFLTFAWLGHWSFGSRKVLFQTFSSSCHTSFRMLIGDWSFEEAWKEGTMQIVWYACFAFVIFFLLMNMFLAIMVEAFLSVKQKNESSFVELSFLEDLCCICLYRILGSYYGWPSHAAIIHHLHTYHHHAWPITEHELIENLCMTQEAAQEWLDFYYRILGDPILSNQVIKAARKKQRQSNDFGFFEQMHKEIDESKKQKELSAIVRIQKVARGTQTRSRMLKLRTELKLRQIDSKINQIQQAIEQPMKSSGQPASGVQNRCIDPIEI